MCVETPLADPRARRPPVRPATAGIGRRHGPPRRLLSPFACPCLATLLAVSSPSEGAVRDALSGLVVDASSGDPIAGASVTRGGLVVVTGADGRWELPGDDPLVKARAPGFVRRDLPAAAVVASDGRIELAPFRARALYLSFFGIGDRGLREDALDLLAATELNALVIDVKGDSGRIPWASAIPLAVEVGATRRRTIPDAPALLARLKASGVYTIGRLVVYKDTLLSRGRPELAVLRQDGRPYRDREGLGWVDPFRPEVRAYVLDVADEAARLGFDEIQLDYVRFPAAAGLRFSEPSTEESRVEAIGTLLAELRRRLVPHNVFLSADVFGYVCWNRGDTLIGQRLEDLAPLVDYVSPMLYPSSFHLGLPRYRKAVAHPAEIVRLSLASALRRTGRSPLSLRPWLQAFRDYAFDRRPFGAAEIRAQVDAAEGVGTAGWMLWNPRNHYGKRGLRSP